MSLEEWISERLANALADHDMPPHEQAEALRLLNETIRRETGDDQTDAGT